MNGKADVLFGIDLARIRVPTASDTYDFEVGYGNRIVIYVVQETPTDGTMLAAYVVEDGGRIEIRVDP